MSDRNKQRLPIGYWLKRADELLTIRIDDAQRANGLTRLEWQILNVIREQRATARAAVADILQPFGDEMAMNQALVALGQREWVVGSSEDRLELTQAGIDVYERALASQKVIRQRAVAGISEADYATTLAVLQRLVENLERGDVA